MGAVSALDSSVLVLNRNYTAIQITTARRAFCLLFKEAAEVIAFDDDNTMSAYDIHSWMELTALRRNFPPDDQDEEYVRTVSFDIRVPKIIRLLIYDRLPRQQVKFNRRNIFARDGNRCQYCGRRRPTSELSLDHVVPRSRGGDASWENIVCACVPSPNSTFNSIGAAFSISRCRFKISVAVVWGGINSCVRRYQFRPLPGRIDSTSRPLSIIELTERGRRALLCRNTQNVPPN